MNALQIVTRSLQAAGYQTYAIAAEQGADPGTPFIVVSLVSERSNSRLEDAAGQYEALVSIACHAAGPAALIDFSEEVKADLERITLGAYDDGNVPPTNAVGFSFHKAEADVTDFSDNLSIFRRVMDFRVLWWRFPA
jgi:hypothetical protein